MDFLRLAEAKFALVCEVEASLSSPGFYISSMGNPSEDLLELHIII